VQNVYAPLGDHFALSDLRVFGDGGGEPPKQVEGFNAERDQNDNRNVTFTWTPVENADGYMIRIGTVSDSKLLSLQVRGGASSKLTTHMLNRNVKYFFFFFAYNENGVSVSSKDFDSE
jgi:hypothetical protein